ncbi:MAG: biopolymer transporter ExbD [Methylococcaceae bacterium]|nr:biopolymer transporter ExbD [Methylococcaceae bacterium]MCI0668302.1 biopolymer transporter ExbD [Methylococcaceae bacterium]MCI0733024.1 biopolymer transporter ExbD [Methylococcaceae bacterium]
MNPGGFNRGNRQPQPMAEINTTPLVDVMLVLLVIFILTAPLLTHSLKIDLPQAKSQPNPEKMDTITLSINADSRLFWDGAPIEDQELSARLTTAARKDPQLELHIRASKTTSYQRLATVLSAAQRAGINKIGFVTEPIP